MMSKEQRDAIRIRLMEIEAANGGVLTPDAVIADAKDPDSPLHDQFEWDTDKAAYKYWLDQARALITSVKVVQKIEQQKISTVYYVRDPRVDADEQGYVSLTTLKSDEDLARDAIHAEFMRARAVMERAHSLAAVLNLTEEVEELQTRIGSLVEITKPQTV